MIYKNSYTDEISFPLGGIGSGSIGLGGNGRLLDWEIFNRPNKGSINGYSHIAIKTQIKGETRVKVLQGDYNRALMGQYEKKANTGYGFGPDKHTMCGFPHFRRHIFKGEFPFACIEFEDKDFPAKVMLHGFNPFIPLDADNSSLPAAFFEVEIQNTYEEELDFTVAFSMMNPFPVSVNFHERDGSITFLHAGKQKDELEYGDLTLATDCADTQLQAYWYRGRWQDGIVSFWNDFISGKKMPERSYDTPGSNDHGTLCSVVKVKAKETASVRFVITWNIPNYSHSGWFGKDSIPWKNYYATRFTDSRESADYCLEHWEELYCKTRKFHDALFASSLDASVLDAISANLSVLKSPTVLRLEDGSFYGWEGVQELAGSCEGTCQHVWNYAYALCYLFPDLERSIRELEFKYSTDMNGRMQFRLILPLGNRSDRRACLDGQMGAVFKCYREWKISGDDNWLKNNWDMIKKVLEYAWNVHNPDCWDRNRDGVLEGMQHHTLDMELFGPSSWLEGMYLLALKTAAQMAEYLGDIDANKEYLTLYNNGYQWVKDNLFNGKYFIQKIDISDKSIVDKYNAQDDYWNEETKEIKYQIAGGSAIDQVLACWHGLLIGVDGIFDEGQLKTALLNMYENNYKSSLRNFTNPWRVFALNDEGGAIICNYPKGSRKPAIPLPYTEEVMTGFEYQFAGLLISKGMVEEGVGLVRAIRKRYDGKKRNPWNEIECGSNYARSMASFALLPIFLGFTADLPAKNLTFKPVLSKIRGMFSVGSGWGEYLQEENSIEIFIHGGSLTLGSLTLPLVKSLKTLMIDGKEYAFNFVKPTIFIEETVIMKGIKLLL